MTVYITNYACSGWTAYREVGYGHQMKDQLTALLIANIFGYTYVNHFHKPIASMGLHQGCMKLSDLPEDIPRIIIERTGVRNGMPYNRLRKLNDECREKTKHGEDVLVVIMRQSRVLLHQLYEWQQEGKIQHDAFMESREIIYNKFMMQNDHVPVYIDDNKKSIALHIRRGDTADPTLKQTGRMGIQKDDNPHIMHSCLPVAWFKRITDMIITNEVKQESYEIHVYTETRHSDDVVQCFESVPHCTLHIGEPFISDFKNIVHCDYIVMSNSGMSTLAGYMSLHSKKYYHPNPHSPTTLPQPEYNIVYLEDGEVYTYEKPKNT